ncbi:hypothetical protein [Streptomyces sp. MBT62]|uniref:hypothetical protein n=1 Tax=Streptomyces sp. MBT62 TaxID=2800410 RepID=UPI00190B6817|nr:hypothetical protein [Streptomyces sp. MBT62]MBK3564217.1 hypothetical protein [Streptomyces sp. MBT62]
MRHRLAQRFAVLCASAGVFMGVGLVAGTAAHASASTLTGCGHPYVCVYNARQAKVGNYRDVTRYWQTFSRGDVTYAYNARQDGAAYFLYSSGYTSCVEPGRQAALRIRGYGNVTGIRIDIGPRCYG